MTWVTSRSERGAEMSREGLIVELLPEHHRGPVALLRNALAAVRLVARSRPRIVVTSGAGVVAPYCLVARLAGARLVYVETMARVTSPSMTARILSRVASKVIVQWQELRAALPGAHVCRPTLLEGVRSRRESEGRGTFVAVGTHAQPYHRLLRLVSRAAERGVLPSPVRAQVGAAGGWSSPGVDAVQWLSQDEMDDGVTSADIVICHAGAGTIAAALEAGRRPLVLPRRPELGEHVDEHQQQIATKLASWDLVVLLDDELDERHVQAARQPLEVPRELTSAPTAAELVRDELAA